MGEEELSVLVWSQTLCKLTVGIGKAEGEVITKIRNRDAMGARRKVVYLQENDDELKVKMTKYGKGMDKEGERARNKERGMELLKAEMRAVPTWVGQKFEV